jgi:hypothetical protein
MQTIAALAAENPASVSEFFKIILLFYYNEQFFRNRAGNAHHYAYSRSLQDR